MKTTSELKIKTYEYGKKQIGISQCDSFVGYFFYYYYYFVCQQEIIPHPNYSLTKKKNDIALIRLVDRLWITKFIQPVCIQTDPRDEGPHVDLIVAGWGQTQSKLKQIKRTFFEFLMIHVGFLFQQKVLQVVCLKLS